MVGLPWLVLVRFGGDAFSLGLLLAAVGAGSLVGVLAAGSCRSRAGSGRSCCPRAVLMGVGLGALGLAPSPIVAGAILLAIGTMNG